MTIVIALYFYKKVSQYVTKSVPVRYKKCLSTLQKVFFDYINLILLYFYKNVKLI